MSKELTKYKKELLDKLNLKESELNKVFSEVFWDHQNPCKLIIPLMVIKKSFDNTKDIFPNDDPSIIKRQLFIEILIKFCKLAEDFGGLVSSKDDDMFKFAQNYNTFKVDDVLSFYDTLSLDDNSLNKLLCYPAHNKQCDKAKGVLELSYMNLKESLERIKEEYTKHREAYNSYKHGFRIRFEDAGDFEVGNKVYKNSKILFYYNSKSLKKDPHIMSLIVYENFSDYNFNELYNLCLDLMDLMNIFISNFRESKNESRNKPFNIFFCQEQKEDKAKTFKDVIFNI
ncbi:MAG: hypothetical protein WC413_01590 [Candidatus Nanoarchaeia archaeon]